MNKKPSTPCLVQKSGMAIGSYKGFGSWWNWMQSWLSNLKVGKGLKISGSEVAHPQLEANLTAGTGIYITTKSDGSLRISTEDDAEDEPIKSADQDTATNDGSSGSDSSSSSGSGTSGSGSSGAGSSGSSGSGSDSADDCNQWSDDEGNDDSDSGVGNEGDNCSTLNGW